MDEKTVQVVDLKNNNLLIFSQFNNSTGVKRTVDQLMWTIQTFGEENPQVGIVGENLRKLFQSVEPQTLVRRKELNLGKVVRRFKEGRGGPDEKSRSTSRTSTSTCGN